MSRPFNLTGPGTPNWSHNSKPPEPGISKRFRISKFIDPGINKPPASRYLPGLMLLNFSDFTRNCFSMLYGRKPLFVLTCLLEIGIKILHCVFVCWPTARALQFVPSFLLTRLKLQLILKYNDNEFALYSCQGKQSLCEIMTNNVFLQI